MSNHIPTDLVAETKSWRQHLHQHPELGLEEFQTQKYLLGIIEGIQNHAQLKPEQMIVDTDWDPTGIVVLLKGKPHPTHPKNKLIGLRADMDALPLKEENNLTYKSSVDLKMHACGHDGHMAMLLGALKHMASQIQELCLDVCFIFQPAEEGPGGAKIMMDQGLYKRYPMDAIFGIHNWPDLPLGRVGISYGAQMAATDEIHLEVQGLGGHAAFPHQCVDPIVVGSQIILSLQNLISRSTGPLQSAVLTIGHISGGHTFNIIPDKVQMKGTLRTLDPKHRSFLKEKIQSMVEHVAKAHGASAQARFAGGYPATINHKSETDRVCEAVEAEFGKGALNFPFEPSMGGEDFSYFLQEIPGAYIRLGSAYEESEKSGDKSSKTYPLHSPYFNFNDASIPHGIRLWTRLCQLYAGEKA